MVSSDVVIGASFLIMFTTIGHFTGLGLGFWTVLISHIAFLHTYSCDYRLTTTV